VVSSRIKDEPRVANNVTESIEIQELGNGSVDQTSKTVIIYKFHTLCNKYIYNIFELLYVHRREKMRIEDDEELPRHHM